MSTVYNDARQDALYKKEEKSWWFRYRAEVIKCLVEKYFDNTRIIWDIGAGNGYSSWILQNAGYSVAAMEPSYEACRNAIKRGIKSVYCGALDDEGVHDDSLESAMVLDVIEHLEDDEGFLCLLYKKLSEDAYLLITVPAFMSLWSSNDINAGHFRRYSYSELKDRCEKAGFTVLYGNYFMRFCYLPILLIRVIMVNMGIIHRTGHKTEKEAKRVAKLEHGEKKGFVRSALRMLQKIELGRIQMGRSVPYGSSLVMVLKKRGVK